MQWEVKGADRQTGEDRSVILEANDEAQATRRAARQGLLVESARPLDPNDSVISPSLETAAAPPPLPAAHPMAYAASGNPSAKRSSIRTVVLMIIGGLFMVGLTAKFFTKPSAYNPRPTKPDDAAVVAARARETVSKSKKPDDADDKDKAAKIEQFFRKQVKDGVLYEVNFNRGIIRVEPLRWDSSEINDKRTIVMLMMEYRACVGDGSHWARVMSSRNDDVFAEGSKYTGVKIFR